MTWQWVAIILGLATNITILWVAMSPGAQYRMGDGKVIDYGELERRDCRGEATKTQDTISGKEIKRSPQPDVGSTRRV
jgi:hypothetical protein